MSELESLRAFVNVRLIAAAEEICGAVEKTIAEFVETFTERQNKMLNIVIKPGFTQDVLVQNVEEEVTYFQEQPEPLLIKEEEEHVLISQEATSLDVQGSGVPEPSADCQPLSSDCSEAECEDGEDHDNAVENGPMSRSGLGELLKDGAKRSYEETEGSESDFETSELNKSTKSCEKTESQGGYDPCQCKVCGKFFRYKANLIKHASFHTNNQEFLCGICGERQDSSENLTLHLKSHVKGRKICPTCGKSYSSTALLKVHGRIHTGEKPYKCNSCHKHFTHRTACVRHIMAVHPEKMCCAGECGKEFSDQRHLNQHMAAHRGKKPYNCNDCGKGFKFVGRLERK